jgi:hypothetical protein
LAHPFAAKIEEIGDGLQGPPMLHALHGHRFIPLEPSQLERLSVS